MHLARQTPALRAAIVALLWITAMTIAFGQEPDAPPPKPPRAWTGTAGLGVSLTSGNSDTTNFNIAFDITRDSKTRNVLKLTGLYMRGDRDDTLSVNRTSIGLRDQYRINGHAFVFGQVDYLRDTFKLIDYLIAPTAGLGYKIVDTEPTVFSVDLGGGAVWEKNPDAGVSTSAAVTVGEKLTHQLTATTALKQGTSALWDADNIRDGLYTFSLGLATRISTHFELTVDLLNTFKSRPPTEETQRNDVAIVTAFTAKF